MKSIPYKNVISSLSFFKNSQVMNITLYKSKFELDDPYLRLLNKGSIKLDFLTSYDHPTIPGRSKLVLDSKIETYIYEHTIFEILTKKSTFVEYKNFMQDIIRFEVTNNGLTWKIKKKNDERVVELTQNEGMSLHKMLEFSIEYLQGWYVVGDCRVSNQALGTKMTRQ